MKNQHFFEQISRIHDNNYDVQLLNLILGAYQEIQELDKKNTELTTKVNELDTKLTKVIENILLGTSIKTTNTNTTTNNEENAEEVM